MAKKKKGRNKKNAQERAAGAGAVWDAASAEASRADPHTSADIASAAPDSCAEADSLRRALKAALEKRDDEIRISWRNMPLDARAALLKTVSPYLPRFAGDQDSGGPGKSRGVCALCPELCVRELSEDPEQLIQLLNEWTSTEFEPYVQDNADMHFLRRRGVLQAADFTGKSIVLTIPGMRGKTLTITEAGAGPTATAKLQSYVHKGAAIPTAAYHKVRMRQTSILQLLVLVVDEIRSELLDRKPHMTLIQARGCVNCGVQATKLRHCNACRLVGYCSKECQVADWPSHKEFCKAHRREHRRVIEPAVDAQGGDEAWSGRADAAAAANDRARRERVDSAIAARAMPRARSESVSSESSDEAARRRRRGDDAESDSDDESDGAMPPLEDAADGCVPPVPWRAESIVRRLAAAPPDEAACCPICLDALGGDVVEMPCRWLEHEDRAVPHAFHRDCALELLNASASRGERVPRCPTCRDDFPPHLLVAHPEDL